MLDELIKNLISLQSKLDGAFVGIDTGDNLSFNVVADVEFYEGIPVVIFREGDNSKLN